MHASFIPLWSTTIQTKAGLKLIGIAATHARRLRVPLVSRSRSRRAPSLADVASFQNIPDGAKARDGRLSLTVVIQNVLG